MPEGIEYRGSWVTEDLRRCFQIMECEDRRLLEQWIANWSDITDNFLYSNSNTSELTLTGIMSSMNGYLYRCIANAAKEV